MQKILSTLTSNRFMGLLLGLAVTAVIQSSSATTVMVVGFVNNGIMALRQAIGVIWGQHRNHRDQLDLKPFRRARGQLLASDAQAHQL